MSPLERLTLAAGWVMLTLYVASVILAFVNPDFEVDATLRVVVGVIIGALFTPMLVRRNRK